jgi:hypothetical protein
MNSAAGNWKRFVHICRTVRLAKCDLRKSGDFRIPEAHFPESFVGVVLCALGEPTKNKGRAFWVDFLEVNFLPGALALDQFILTSRLTPFKSVAE